MGDLGFGPGALLMGRKVIDPESQVRNTMGLLYTSAARGPASSLDSHWLCPTGDSGVDT